MNSGTGGCGDFRSALSRALEGLPVPQELTALSWHEHLLACGACRRLLEREEVLEELLATLPEPKLPPDLARRLLERLRADRERAAGLDRLLEMAEAAPPPGLAARVSAGVREERALDRLLELDRVRVPDGLSARILEAIEPGRSAPGVPERHPFRLLRSPLFYAAAAGFLLVALSLAIWRGLRKPIDSSDGDRVAVEDEAPDPDLLAKLEVLELDTLWKEDEDVHEFLFYSVDVEDRLLLELREEGEGDG